MARRIRAETALKISGVRKLQAKKLRAEAAKLPTSIEVYDFRRQRDYLLGKIEALEAGEDVRLQGFELADELLEVAGLRNRFDRFAPRLWRITGDELVPDDQSFVPVSRS